MGKTVPNNSYLIVQYTCKEIKITTGARRTTILLVRAASGTRSTWAAPVSARLMLATGLSGSAGRLVRALDSGYWLVVLLNWLDERQHQLSEHL